jgi:hypothetical protein
MIRSSLTAAGLGLMIALSLASISVTAAQAEPNAKWLILMENNQVLTGAELHSQAFGSIEPDEGTLVTHMLGATVEVSCTSLELVGAELVESGSTTKTTIVFSGCKTKINGKETEACVPHTEGTSKGTVKSRQVIGLLVLHRLPSGALDDLIEINPVVGDTFYLLEFGEECALSEKISVRGVLYLEDCENKLLQHLVVHLLEQGPLTRLFVLSETKEHLETSLNGSAFTHLIGQHLNRPWSGMAA